jgi:hypothetical protein
MANLGLKLCAETTMDSSFWSLLGTFHESESTLLSVSDWNAEWSPSQRSSELEQRTVNVVCMAVSSDSESIWNMNLSFLHSTQHFHQTFELVTPGWQPATRPRHWGTAWLLLLLRRRPSGWPPLRPLTRDSESPSDSDWHCHGLTVTSESGSSFDTNSPHHDQDASETSWSLWW